MRTRDEIEELRSEFKKKYGEARPADIINADRSWVKDFLHNNEDESYLGPLINRHNQIVFNLDTPVVTKMIGKIIIDHFNHQLGFEVENEINGNMLFISIVEEHREQQRFFWALNDVMDYLFDRPFNRRLNAEYKLWLNNENWKGTSSLQKELSNIRYEEERAAKQEKKKKALELEKEDEQASEN